VRKFKHGHHLADYSVILVAFITLAGIGIMYVIFGGVTAIVYALLMDE